jgi:predicted dinucleotide-binding enzyme
MKIVIIGSDMIGGTLARTLPEAGQEVAVSNSRGPESLPDLVARASGRI